MAPHIPRIITRRHGEGLLQEAVELATQQQAAAVQEEFLRMQVEGLHASDGWRLAVKVFGWHWTDTGLQCNFGIARIPPGAPPPGGTVVYGN